jgi:cardiolipin synthase
MTGAGGVATDRHERRPKGVHSPVAEAIPPLRTSLLTAPNALTLSRVPLAALVWIRPLDPAWVLGLMLLAGVTDVLDGAMERRRRLKLDPSLRNAPTIGVWLDPLCDKVFILSVLAAVTISRHLPLWLIPLIGLREILQTIVVLGLKPLPGFRDRLRPRFRANVVGKLATVFQFLTIGSLLLGASATIPLAFACGALGLVAVGVYFARAMRAGPEA